MKKPDYQAAHDERVRAHELAEQFREIRAAQIPGLEVALRAIMDGLKAQGWQLASASDLAAVPGSVIVELVEAELKLARADAEPPQERGPRLELGATIAINSVLNDLTSAAGARAIVAAGQAADTGTARKRIDRERERQTEAHAANVATAVTLVETAIRLSRGEADDSPEAELIRAHATSSGHSFEAIARALLGQTADQHTGQQPELLDGDRKPL